MNHLRVLNVITLSALLILTGCFGLMPESEADGQDEPEQSTPHLNWHVDSMGIVENEWVIYYSVYDPNMSLTSFGIDTNSDGIVDYPATNSSGFISLNLSDVTSNLFDENYVRVYDTVFVGIMDSEIMFSEILITSNNEYPSIYPTYYDISAVDAGGDVTTGTDDDLVRITMNQGSDINWAAVKISISVDGDAPIPVTTLDKLADNALQLSSETHQTTTGQSVTVSQSQSLDKTYATLEHVPLR